MKKNTDIRIRRRNYGGTVPAKIGLPTSAEGRDGDVRLYIARDGVGLYGRVRDSWYKFAGGQRVGVSGEHNPGDSAQDAHFKNLDIDGGLRMQKVKMSITNNEEFSLTSDRIDIDTKTVGTQQRSELHVGQITLQSAWDRRHSGLGSGLVQTVDGAGGELVIRAGTSDSANGGSLYLAPGLGAGGSSHGNVVIGKKLDTANPAAEVASTAPVFEVNATSTTLSGTLTIGTINTDSAGDNYLVEVSGVVKKRTSAQVLSDIGGGAITALNSATANELVTVGATTTELDAEANLTFDGTDLSIAAVGKIYLDGGTDTYIAEHSADVVRYVVGNDILMLMSEKGDDGNEVKFGACVGFEQIEPTYDATNTYVDFRFSNKQFVTFGSGNITNINLTFPLVSGNFVLLIKQDGTGSRTITNYKVAEFDESGADGSASVKFAGGSNPTLTTDANHVDILSFYWDADNEIAYGVATLDFQF
jgi:hypothetical protein